MLESVVCDCVVFIVVMISVFYKGRGAYRCVWSSDCVLMHTFMQKFKRIKNLFVCLFVLKSISTSPEASNLPAEDMNIGSNGPKHEEMFLDDDDQDDLFAGVILLYK